MKPIKFVTLGLLPASKFIPYAYINLIIIVITIISLLTITGCESYNNPAASSADHLSSTTSPGIMIDPDNFTSESWNYDGIPGSIISTPHYRIMTTLSDPEFIHYVPFFLENALNIYTSVLADLPTPTKCMDTYLFGNRSQWIAYTKNLMGKKAEPYLNIGRGGFSMNGIGVFYDLGRNDTLTIAAHEGWHQFTQGTMRDRLPIWLEEGIATYMEGNQLLSNTTRNYSRSGYYSRRFNKDNYAIADDDEIVFLPWLNQERAYQLRRAVYRKQLFSIEELLNSHPEKLLSESRTKTLNYYSQLWVLIHFLREGENGRYSEALEKLLLDARYKRMQTFAIDQKRKYGSNWLISSSANAKSINSRKDINILIGPDIFLAYFNHNLDEVNTAYQAFISKLITREARNSMAQGISPIKQQIFSTNKESTP